MAQDEVVKRVKDLLAYHVGTPLDSYGTSKKPQPEWCNSRNCMVYKDECEACIAVQIHETYKSLDYVQLDPNRPKVICLCGSGRFKDVFEKAEFEETLKGNIVLTIGCNAHDIARTEELKHHKSMLDELHLRKIDLADEVMILNVGGYIGEFTRKELEYSQAHGKKINYLEPICSNRTGRR